MEILWLLTQRSQSSQPLNAMPSLSPNGCCPSQRADRKTISRQRISNHLDSSVFINQAGELYSDALITNEGKEAQADSSKWEQHVQLYEVEKNSTVLNI